MKVVLPEPAMPMQTIATGSSDPLVAVGGALEVAMARRFCENGEAGSLQRARVEAINVDGAGSVYLELSASCHRPNTGRMTVF